MLRKNISANTITEEQQFLPVTQNRPKGNFISCNKSNVFVPNRKSQPYHFKPPKRTNKKRFNTC